MLITFHNTDTRSLTDARYLGQVATVVSWGQEPNSTATTTESPVATNTTAAANATAPNATTTTTTTAAPTGGRRRRAVRTGTRKLSSYFNHKQTSQRKIKRSYAELHTKLASILFVTLHYLMAFISRNTLKIANRYNTT
jgi:hypothetical protein